jgi:hypothetical protein
MAAGYRDTTNTPDWIWLREALALAVAVLGSVALANERLREWLAAAKVPWSCMSWEGRPRKGITSLLNLGSGAKYPGDPQFWSVGHLDIDWEDNGARERGAGGAQALGVKVSRTHLLELLPGAPRTDNPKGEDGPMVRLAKELMAAEFPQGEWRQMKPMAVRKRCEEKAKTRQVPLPSPDSFSRAMGRRQ